MIDNYDDMKKVPIVDMTIGDVVDFFEILHMREHCGDDDVRRSVSEVRARFMAEALYKYCNHKEPDDETSFAPAREEKENWVESIKDPCCFFTRDARVDIVKVLVDEFKNSWHAGNLGTTDINYSFGKEKYSICELSIYLDMEYDLHIIYQIGDTVYKHSIPVESSDITDETSDMFWGIYGKIILSLTDELIEQIKEGH